MGEESESRSLLSSPTSLTSWCKWLESRDDDLGYGKHADCAVVSSSSSSFDITLPATLASHDVRRLLLRSLACCCCCASSGAGAEAPRPPDHASGWE